jgi:TatA/E family protein of Tat protein translocase
MGFHPVELAILAVILLAIFGPKKLTSMMHEVGKGMGHAKKATEKIMAEVPVEDLTKLKEQVNMAANPSQAVKRLLLDEPKAETDKTAQSSPIKEQA